MIRNDRKRENKYRKKKMLLYQKLCGRLENVVETFSLIGHKVVFSHRMIYGHT